MLPLMAQPPPNYHSQAFADPNAVLNTISDLAIAGLLENISAIRMKPPHVRVAHACDYCRRLKTKCSGEQPECASCKKRGRVCQWTPLKASKCRRSRKPYDAWIPYHPPIAPKAPEHTTAHVAAPRPAYPSVMLPRPMDMGGALVPLAPAPMVKSMVQQSFTVCSASTQYGWDGLDIHPPSQWIPSPPSSLSRSDSSSCESVSPHTPRTPQEMPLPASPSFYPVEDPPQIPSEAFFHDLYQHVSPKWSLHEFETLFTQ